MRSPRWLRLLSSVSAALFLTGCGGSPSSPSAPNPSQAGITFTITSAGVRPKELRIAPGARVLFTNTDTRQHEMGSDPHPEHTMCPEINQIGFITTGQTKETGNLNVVRTCSFHDHLDPDNESLKGWIVIQ